MMMSFLSSVKHDDRYRPVMPTTESNIVLPMRSRRGNNWTGTAMTDPGEGTRLSPHDPPSSAEEPEDPACHGDPLILQDSRESLSAANSLPDFTYNIQRRCFLASFVLSFIALLLVVVWISLLGGTAKVFNWHPLLMVASFCFMTVAALIFRVPAVHFSRNTIKRTHMLAWLIAAVSATLALVAVFKSHNDPASGFIANLYSLHSWIGCAVVLVYIGQFMVGIVSFGGYNVCSNIVTPAGKTKIMLFHKFIGPLLYNATAATILLGIQEKEGFIGCSYAVSEPDIIPFLHLFDIPSTCLVSHALGLVVFLMALSTSLALHNFHVPPVSRSTRSIAEDNSDRLV